jgi:hypothetical protein
MRMLVKASGLPRGNVQILFDQYEQSPLPSAVAVKATKPTRKKSKKPSTSKRARKK